MERQQTQSQTWTQVLLVGVLVAQVIQTVTIVSLNNRRRELEYEREAAQTSEAVENRYRNMPVEYRIEQVHEAMAKLRERYGMSY